MAYSINKYKIICSFVLFLVCVVAILSVYNVNGVGWDFLSHYLNGRTVANGFNNALNRNSALSVGKNFYFDDVWEPLPSIIIAILILFFNGIALQVYLVLLIAFLFVASYITAKNLDVDPLLLSSVVAGPFMISYTILYNGNEVLASSFVLLTVGFIIAKQKKAGISAGLMGLAKYASLFLLPLILFLRKPKDILKAIILFALVTLPWLVFNYVAFGNPLNSYLVQLAETQPQTNTIATFVTTLFSIMKYPLIILIAGVAIIIYFEAIRKNRKKRKLTHIIKNFLKSQQGMVLIAFFVLALLEFGFVFNKTQGAIRLGYMVYLSVSIMAVVIISASSIGKMKIHVSNRLYGSSDILPYLVFFISLILILMLYSSWMQIHFNVLGGLGFKNPEYVLAVNALKSNNLSECSIVSNAWPYMNYYNITTYSPYYCNSTVQKMPIVVFNNEGVSNYCVGTVNNLTNVSQIVKSTNFSIYLPNNYICIK